MMRLKTIGGVKSLHLNVGGEVTLGNNDTGTFVSTDEWKLGWEWPVAVHGVQVSVAYTRVLDVDEDLIWAWLLDWDGLVFDWASGLLDDHSLLLGGDLRGGHVGGIDRGCVKSFCWNRTGYQMEWRGMDEEKRRA